MLAREPRVDRVRLAVVLDDFGVVDRHVGRLLLEVLDRIAALAHHFGDERVGVAERGRRLVDELRLRRTPAFGVAVARGRAQRADVEPAPPFAALAQLGLRGTLVAMLFNGTVVLGPEALAQLCRAPPLIRRARRR